MCWRWFQNHKKKVHPPLRLWGTKGSRESNISHFIEESLDNFFKNEIQLLFHKYHHIFATSYKDLKKVILEEHKIELLLNTKLLQQRPQKMNPNYAQMINEELDKLLDAWFIILVENLKWVSPITVTIKNQWEAMIMRGLSKT